VEFKHFQQGDLRGCGLAVAGMAIGATTYAEAKTLLGENLADGMDKEDMRAALMRFQIDLGEWRWHPLDTPNDTPRFDSNAIVLVLPLDGREMKYQTLDQEKGSRHWMLFDIGSTSRESRWLDPFQNNVLDAPRPFRYRGHYPLLGGRA
jgi:hypothetical protein